MQNYISYSNLKIPTTYLQHKEHRTESFRKKMKSASKFQP